MGRDWRLFVPKTVTVLRQGYGPADFRADAIAGLTVAIVALPLAMALAIASGAPPQVGLVTAVVAGFFISAFGGSRFQIGGPTGAFVVIVYGVIAAHGYDGLLMATLIAGLILVAAGFARLGTLIKYIPDPVTTGFTSGIAVVIMASQVKDFLGLSVRDVPAAFIPKLQALWSGLDSVNPWAVGVAVACFSGILLLRRHAPRAPGFLILTVAASALAAAAGLPVETIGSRFGDISAVVPPPSLAFWDWSKVQAVLPSAFTIALLAGVESLLSAVVADQMTGRRHRSNMELVAQGLANTASAAVGGLPATGAIARTAANIRSGARSPVAGMMHAAFLLVFMMLLAPVMRFVPLAALAAVLMVVALNMAEVNRFRLILRTSPGDRAVLLATFSLTVLVDLTVAIEIGMVMAAFIFMHRMAALSSVDHPGSALVPEDQPDEADPANRYAPDHGVPPEVGLITFHGPMFFGSASSLKDTLDQLGVRHSVYLLRMEDIPLIDPTGAFALEGFLKRLQTDGARVVVSGASREVLRALLQSVHPATLRGVRFIRDFDRARAKAVASISRTGADAA